MGDGVHRSISYLEEKSSLAMLPFLLLQHWISMDHTMHVCMHWLKTSCPATPDCGVFAFGTIGLILRNVWPLVSMSACMVRRSDTLRMFKHCLLVFQLCAPWMHCTHVCLHWVLPSATGGVFVLSLLAAAEGEVCGCTKVHTLTLQCYKMMCSLMQHYIEFLSFHYQAT